MSDVELRIRTTLTGNARSELSALSGQLRAFGPMTANAVGQVGRQAHMTGAAWGLLGRAAMRTGGIIGNTMRDISYGVVSYRSLLVASVAVLAGKTLFEHTLGTADQMQRARLMLRATLGDNRLVEASMQRAIRLAQEIGPLTTAEAFQGMSFMVDLAQGDLEKAAEMVRLAKALEAVEPSQGFGGALFAMRELQSGDVRSMRERFRIMGLPKREDAEAGAAAQGISVAEFYYDALYGELQRRFGADGDAVTALLAVHTNTLGGQLTMAISKVQDALGLLSLGPADRLVDRFALINGQLDKYFASEDWRQDAEAIAAFVERAANGLISFAQNLRVIIPQFREWLSDHEALVKAAGAYMGIEFISRGAIMRGVGGAAVSAVGGVGRMAGRALGIGGMSHGRRGGGFSGIPNGVTPVWVVNGGVGGAHGGAGGAAAARIGGARGLMGGLSRAGQWGLLAAAVLGTTYSIYTLLQGQTQSVGERLEELSGQTRGAGDAVADFSERVKMASQHIVSMAVGQDKYQPESSVLRERQAALEAIVDRIGTLASPNVISPVQMGYDSSGRGVFRRQGITEESVSPLVSQVWGALAGERRFTGEGEQADLISRIEGVLPTGVGIADAEGRRIRQGRLFEAEYPQELLATEEALRTVIAEMGRNPEFTERLRATGEYEKLEEAANWTADLRGSIDALVLALNRANPEGPRIQVDNTFQVLGDLDHSFVRRFADLIVTPETVWSAVDTALTSRGEQ